MRAAGNRQFLIVMNSHGEALTQGSLDLSKNGKTITNARGGIQIDQMTRHRSGHCLRRALQQVRGWQAKHMNKSAKNGPARIADTSFGKSAPTEPKLLLSRGAMQSGT